MREYFTSSINIIIYNIDSQTFCDYHKIVSLKGAGRLAQTCPHYPLPQARDLEKQLADLLTQPLYGLNCKISGKSYMIPVGNFRTL